MRSPAVQITRFIPYAIWSRLILSSSQWSTLDRKRSLAVRNKHIASLDSTRMKPFLNAVVHPGHQAHITVRTERIARRTWRLRKLFLDPVVYSRNQSQPNCPEQSHCMALFEEISSLPRLGDRFSNTHIPAVQTNPIAPHRQRQTQPFHAPVFQPAKLVYARCLDCSYWNVKGLFTADQNWISLIASKTAVGFWIKMWSMPSENILKVFDRYDMFFTERGTDIFR